MKRNILRLHLKDAIPYSQLVFEEISKRTQQAQDNNYFPHRLIKVGRNHFTLIRPTIGTSIP